MPLNNSNRHIPSLVECVKLDECSDWPMPGIHSMCPIGGLGFNGKTKMIDISYVPNITNSPFGGASWSWMLPSNNSSPYGGLENPTTIVDLLDFRICPLMNLTSNEVLWLVPIC